MKVSVKSVSPTKVKVTITLGTSELEAAKNVALTKLAKTMKVPGFRKGKVPASVAAKHANPMELAEATLDNALSRAVAEAFTEQKLRALERPEVEVTKYVPDEMAEFTAEAEIIPEIKLGDYKKLTLKKRPAVKIAKAQVDEVVDRIAMQLGETKEVTRKAKMGDELLLDFVGKKDGIAFDGGTAKDYTLTLGSEAFIPGFEDGLVGHSAGETVELSLKFPDEYHVADLAGADVVFETKVKEVREKKAAKVDDDMAAKVGPYKTVDDLRHAIEAELKTKAEEDQRTDLRDEVVEALVLASTVPVPQVLVDDQLRSIEQDLQQNLASQGMTFDDYLKLNKIADRAAWVEKEAQAAAEQRVKAGLVLAEVTQQENVTVAPDDVQAEVERYKRMYANQPEMAKRFDEPAVRQNLVNRMTTEKTIDTILALNKK